MADNGVEVVGLMRTNTGDNTNQPSLNPVKTPELERHISSIPLDDTDNANVNHAKSKNPLKKIKDRISDQTSRKRAGDQPATGDSSEHPPVVDMPTALRRTISDIPVDDYDSEEEQPEVGLSAAAKNDPDEHERHDSGVSGSDFEVAPMLRISSDEVVRPNIGTKRPELERHISQLPQEDEHGRGAMSKLERTISHIPQDDYDSDD